MKTLQKFLLVIGMLTAAPIFNACTDYQDEIDALDYRVTVLENLVSRMNSELESLQTILDAVEDGDYITDVTRNSEGYIITFHNSGAIIIHDGKDGHDGLNGKDAQAPEITVQMGPDSVYYWVVNGEPIIGPDGEMVRANGKDGKDGKDGENGKDGVDGKDGKDGKAVAPQVRINPETSIWEISFDGGETWQSTGTSCKGNDGKDGVDGKDGKDGVDGKDGKDGKDGQNGQNGKDGNDGKDGKDGKDGNNIIQQLEFWIDQETGITYVRFYLVAGGYFDVPLTFNK